MITFDNIYDHAAACTLYADAPVPSKTGRYRRLTTEVSFLLSNGNVLTIKPGFEWDEASVPWLFQPLYPKSGIYAASALVHDALYYHSKYNRLWVEEEFIRWMIASGVSKKQALWRFMAVLSIGWTWYLRNRYWPSERCIRNRQYIVINHCS